MVRTFRALGSLALGAVAALLLAAGAGAAPVPAATPVGSASLVLNGNGALHSTISVWVPDGSPLRYAMDGNFTLLVNALPINDSAKANLLKAIEGFMQNPIYAGLFGNGDGTVSPVEVSLFETLLLDGSQILPAGSLIGTGNFGVTIDGARPSSQKLEGVVFDNATGPVTSSAPILVVTDLVATYALSGDHHTVGISTGVTLPGSLPALGPDVVVTFTSPTGTSITGTTGFTDVSTTNDFWGYGSGTTSGSFPLLNNSTVSIEFGPSFPMGDVVVGLIVAGAAAAAIVLLWHRRRKSREALAPGTAGPGDQVGPSGSG